MPTVERLPEMIDDFFRNFLVRLKFDRTLDTFQVKFVVIAMFTIQAEYYEKMDKGEIQQEKIGAMPEIYNVNQVLEERVEFLQREINRCTKEREDSAEYVLKYKKERDFHRIHHKRVGQEKNRAVQQLQAVEEKKQKLQLQVEELQRMNEAAKKERANFLVEKDKLARRVQGLTPSRKLSANR